MGLPVSLLAGVGVRLTRGPGVTRGLVIKYLTAPHVYQPYKDPGVWTQTQLVAVESSSHCDLMYSRLLRAAAPSSASVASAIISDGC